jgi:alkanesulfonate monooxygenase SsuD/methylene tetrahydromethanopterin reductase-like flavin-dependent oxidoreductase (luciferase family)
MRAVFRGEPARATASCAVEGVRLEPATSRPGGPPVWIGSWGSDAGLRRVAKRGDGWLASAYNTTPEHFAEAKQRLDGYVAAAGKPATGFPNGIATMFMYVTNDSDEAARTIDDVIAPAVRREPADLRDRLLVGAPEPCARLLRAYRDAGADRICVWPVADEVRQLELVARDVLPQVM